MRPPKLVYSLCPSCSACPAVDINYDGTVRIGEPPNVATLRREEWNELVSAIRNGHLGAQD